MINMQTNIWINRLKCSMIWPSDSVGVMHRELEPHDLGVFEPGCTD